MRCANSAGINGRAQRPPLCSSRNAARHYRRLASLAWSSGQPPRPVQPMDKRSQPLRLSLSDVALVCGFADQSPLTRVFTGTVGVSPGAWHGACVNISKRAERDATYVQSIATSTLNSPQFAARVCRTFRQRSKFRPSDCRHDGGIRRESGETTIASSNYSLFANQLCKPDNSL